MELLDEHGRVAWSAGRFPNGGMVHSRPDLDACSPIVHSQSVGSKSRRVRLSECLVLPRYARGGASALACRSEAKSPQRGPLAEASSCLTRLLAGRLVGRDRSAVQRQ